MQTLLDYLEAGDTTTDFLDDFPTVAPEQVKAALHLVRDSLVAAAAA